MWGPVAAFLQPGVCPIFLLTSITSLFYWPARFLCLLWAFGLFRAVSTCRATVAMSLGAERQLGCGSQSWGTLYGAWGVRASLLTSSCSYCSPFWVTVSFLRRGDFPGVAQVFPILDIFVLLCALWRQSILGGDGGEGERRDCPPPLFPTTARASPSPSLFCRIIVLSRQEVGPHPGVGAALKP